MQMDWKWMEDKIKQFDVTEDGIERYEKRIESLSYLKIRDVLWKIGKVLEEDTELCVYTATIKCRGNTAFMVIHYERESIFILSYAREGIIKQHTNQRAVQKLIMELEK